MIEEKSHSEPVHNKIPEKNLSKWDMSQERAFMENLLSQRFNYFIVFYSIVVAGFVNSKNLLYSQLILILGAIITTLLGSTLHRAQQKLDLILEELFNDKSHPATIINDKAGGSKGSKRRLIGITIPAICYWTLIIGATLHILYVLLLYFHHIVHLKCKLLYF